MSNTYLENEYRKAVSKPIIQLMGDLVELFPDMTMEELKELKALIDDEIEERRRLTK